MALAPTVCIEALSYGLPTDAWCKPPLWEGGKAGQFLPFISSEETEEGMPGLFSGRSLILTYHRSHAAARDTGSSASETWGIDHIWNILQNLFKGQAAFTDSKTAVKIKAHRTDYLELTRNKICF